MPASAEGPTQVARQRAHVDAFTGRDLENGAIHVRRVDQLDAINMHAPSRQLDRPIGTREA